MHTIKVKETCGLSHPFLQERLKQGRRLGTREFVALLDGVEAGLLIFEHFPNHSLGIVYEIYVLKEFRRSGVGDILLAYAEVTAQDSACSILRLWARSLDQEFINDQSLVAWYSQRGFNRDDSDSGLMQKSL